MISVGLSDIEVVRLTVDRWRFPRSQPFRQKVDTETTELLPKVRTLRTRSWSGAFAIEPTNKL
jgi:hypothetical protein